MAETNKTLRLTQVKSAIGRKPNQGRTLRALGLHGIGSIPTLRFRQAPGLAPCLGHGVGLSQLGPKAGQFQAPVATSLTPLGEPVSL